MNIKQAKQEITNTLKAYLAKDQLGNYLIPTVRQRPVLLMGPPGVGKTQIMEQIAAETGVGLVAYTITHHTRQSAIGLPFIEKRTYGGEEVSVTEYTMSEILSSVYRLMERTGLQEGILFLDEINCVSETLAPMMLQFLQCKTFGNQALPEGWLIVAAGNPPEYNKSVRDFDVVTLDRVKRIDVEEDYGVWKEYARRKNLHGAILSYLDIKKDNFYRIENTADGLQFATARLQIFDFLTDTDIFHRDLELVGYTDNHTSFGGSIEFCNSQSVHFRRQCKLLGLFVSILSGGAIQYQQHFIRSLRQDLFHYIFDLCQLIHQVYFIMQPSGGVDNHDISSVGLGFT